MCYLKITPATGFVYGNGIGYNIDFNKKTADIFPFAFDIFLAEE